MAAPMKLPVSIFAYQPFKALYITARFLNVLVSLPYWTSIHFFTSRYPASWGLHEVLLVSAMRSLTYIISTCDIPHNVRPLDVLPSVSSLKHCRPLWIEPMGEKWVVGIGKSELAKPVRTPAYLYGADRKGTGEIKVAKGETIVLYFHGGGLVVGTAHESDLTAVNAKQICRLTKASQVLSVDYRKVSQGCFPAAILDAVSAYVHLIEKVKVAPERIILAGDSAGGHLALAVTRYLRDGGWQVPKALVLFSPWCSMINDINPRVHLFPAENASTDYLALAGLQPYISDRLLMQNPISLIDSPWLSSAAETVPATVELFEGFPPCLVTAGGKESLLGQIRELVLRFKFSSVAVEYYVEPDAPHDFQCLPFGFGGADKRCWARVTEFINAQIESTVDSVSA